MGRPCKCRGRNGSSCGCSPGGEAARADRERVAHTGLGWEGRSGRAWPWEGRGRPMEDVKRQTASIRFTQVGV